MSIDDMSSKVALELGSVGTLGTTELPFLATLELAVLVQRLLVFVDFAAKGAQKKLRLQNS